MTSVVTSVVRELDADEIDLLGLELGLELPRPVFELYATTTPTTERTNA